MRAYVETTGVLAEAYISLTVILGIVLFALFAVQSLSLGQGKSGLDTSAVQTSIVFSTVVIPVISAAFMFIIHLSQPREPTTFYSPYIIFAASTLAIPIMFLIPIPLELPMRVGLGLLISTIPPAVIAMRESAHKKGVESKLPSFLVDLTEVRKTGLPPERGIEQLAMRDYGAFSKYVQGMSAQLSWGVSLEKVMGNFTTSVRSWIARVTAFLLLEVTEVGGGTVKMFVALSEFSQKLQELEKERRSQLRLYLLLPYMGAIMIVATTGLLLGFIATPSFTLPGAPPLPKPSAGLSAVATTLFSGIIVESWAMGFVAGKMGEGNVAAGFKHAGILTAVTLGTVYLMKLFLPSL